ncbi:MAG: hypothetical protein U5S82_01490 [Gammaproteobacteria bacterium]|nr:hypothetical protein [Gammaproteobacteria bacterium]
MNMPNVIHAESSDTSEDGFPLEIGLVLHNGAAYCLVARPEAAGFPVASGAEQATGLTPEVRDRRALAAPQLALELNRALGDDTVHFDDRGPGAALLRRLFDAAGVAPSFRMEPLQALLTTDQRRDWERATLTALEEQRHIRNRASDKALVLQQTLVRSAQ